ncbi:MAG: glutamate-cysteine ligase family protein [bacterium]
MGREALMGSGEELARFFMDACKPREQWRIGCEFEKLGIDLASGRAVPFSGPRGVERILADLAERFGWEPKREGSRLLSLERDSSKITLEPGSQLELSSAPRETVHELAAELRGHIEELIAVSERPGIAWLGLGIQPLSSWEEIELLPKARYDIMNRHLARCGSLSRSMMRETASTQVNLDYENEADAVEKFRLAMALTPLLTALFANSAISRGASNGFLSRRAHIWQDTDPHRSGFIERLFHADAAFGDYVAYALDVPMLFIVREDRWVDVGEAVTFRQFLESGFGNERATRADWILHLSTIFTEARLEPYVELRSADCPPPFLAMAFPALAKGIFYDDEARRAAWEMVQPWSAAERQRLYRDVTVHGPRAEIRGSRLQRHIRDLVSIAAQGLRRQARLDAAGRDESVYLAPLEDLLDRGWECPARQLLDDWAGPWKGDVRKLIESSRF